MSIFIWWRLLLNRLKWTPRLNRSLKSQCFFIKAVWIETSHLLTVKIPRRNQNKVSRKGRSWVIKTEVSLSWGEAVRSFLNCPAISVQIRQCWHNPTHQTAKRPNLPAAARSGNGKKRCRNPSPKRRPAKGIIRYRWALLGICRSSPDRISSWWATKLWRRKGLIQASWAKFLDRITS